MSKEQHLDNIMYHYDMMKHVIKERYSEQEINLAKQNVNVALEAAWLDSNKNESDNEIT